MSFYSAFPTSPLSRSALASETTVPQHAPTKLQLKPAKAYAHISAFPPFDLHSSGRSATTVDAQAVRLAPDSLTPLGHTTPAFSAAPSSRHASGPARLMHSPFAPSRSPTPNSPYDDAYAVSPPLLSSSFSRSVNTRRRSSGYSISACSPTPNFGSLVGSFQESLLCGRMSMPASKPLVFDAQIGVLGMGRCKPSLRCPPHLHVKFPAHFYHFHAIHPPASAPNLGSTAALGSPYVGTIDLEAHYHNILLASRLSSLSTDSTSSARLPSASASDPVDLPSFPGYAVPPKGQIQLIVKYPDLNAVKLFLVPYDLTDMRPATKTFVRQKTIVRNTTPDAVSTDERHSSTRNTPNCARPTPKEALRFAIHLQFCCPPVKPQHDDHQAGFDASNARRIRVHPDPAQTGSKKATTKPVRSPKIYLHKTIRLVFGARATDSGEKLVDQVETPAQGAERFSSYAGPEDDWLQLLHQAKSAHRSADKPSAASFTDSTASTIETGTSALRPTRSGLGIAIQAPAVHSARCSADDQAHNHVAPLNSDPDGERWQGGACSAQQASITYDQHGGRMLSPTTAWSISSHGSSFGRHIPVDGSVPVGCMTLPSGSGSEMQPSAFTASASGLGRSLTATVAEPSSGRTARWTQRSEPSGLKLDAESSIGTEPLSSTLPTQTGPSSRSPLLPHTRASRIRSASTASVSEARVQSVSALVRVEECTQTSSHTDSTCADSPFTLRHQRAAAFTRNASGDRPSLLRKLSEQFGRSHTPSPIASPKLRPTWPSNEDALVEMAIDDPNGAGTDPIGDQHHPAAPEPRQHATRSIR